MRFIGTTKILKSPFVPNPLLLPFSKGRFEITPKEAMMPFGIIYSPP